MAKGTPLKEGKAGEKKFRDIDKTGNPKRKPLSRRVAYGYKAHAGPQHIPMSEIGANMADDLWDQEMTRDLFGDNPRGAASNKRVSDKLKNVMKSKAAGDASDPRAEGHPDIPYDYDEPNSLYDGFVGPIDPKMEGKNPPIDADHGKGHLPLNSKAVAGKLKNVATTKKAPGEKKRPPIPPYKPRGSTSSKKIPARKKPKLPLTGLSRYGNQVR